MFDGLVNQGWALILIYIVLAAIICFLSKKLADYVDALDKKTSISGAFIGAVMLAAVTSLPELFTSISATLLLPDSANLVTGNILGSNLFNLAIIGATMIFFIKKFASAKIEYKSHFTVLIGVVAIYAIVAYGLFAPKNAQPLIGPINLLSVAIILVYALTVYLQPKESEDDEEKEDPLPNLSLKQVIIRFVICAILLVAASILITYCTDSLSKAFKLSSTFAGAVFLAIATSLPELVSTIVLAKKGNFDAAIGDIVGSCLFNFIIIGLAEFMAYKTSLLPGGGWAANKEACLILVLTVIILVFLSASLFNKYKTKEKKTTSKLSYSLYAASGVILVAGYLVFLIINMTV